MPDVHANGLRFNTQVLRRSGAADAPRPPVVMLHGLVMDNLSSWYMTMANPLAQIADVYLYDLRGHGRTDRPPTGYSLEDNVADLVGLLDAWEVGEPAYLFGNSFGCVVALELARRHPERVAGLFLIEAHYAATGWGEALAASLDRVTTGMSDDVVREYLATIAGRKFKKLVSHAEGLLLGTSIIDELRADAGRPIETFAEITAPTLAVYGADSDILDRGQALEANMSGCELVVLEGCSHSLLMEAGPALCERAIPWIQGAGQPVAASERARGTGEVS
jgi:pimeloyl-ACP methyl ester carboxylesterase